MSGYRRVFNELQLTGSYVNATESTKKYRINSDSNPPNSTLTYVTPNISTKLLGDNTIDTITNKTINSSTNIVGANILRSGIPVELDSGSTPVLGQSLVYDGMKATWQTVSGGTPGGLDRQFQFNNAGAFGGSDTFTLSSGTNRPQISVPITQQANIPTAPINGAILYPMNYGNSRSNLAIRGDNNRGYEIGPALYDGDISTWRAVGGGSTATAQDGIATANFGTANGAAITSNGSTIPQFTQFRRISYTASGNSNACGVRSTNLYVTRPKGFYHVVKFGFQTMNPNNNNNTRCFVGLTSSTSNPPFRISGNSDFGTNIAISMIGIGFAGNQTSWQLIYGSTTGAKTLVEITSETNLPVRVDNTMYEARIYQNPLDSVNPNRIYATITALTQVGSTAAGTSFSASADVNLDNDSAGVPNTVVLAPTVWFDTGNNGNNTITCAVSTQYLEMRY